MYIKLDKTGAKSLYISLFEAISEEIACGRLPNGAKLPSRRSLAEELHISQNTVESAYKMLQDTGYVTSVPRRGNIVSFKSSAYPNDLPWEINAPEQVVYTPNGTDTSHINIGAYAKIARNVAYNEGVNAFTFMEKNGEFVLRNAISKFLYSFRSIKCAPDKIIRGAGAEYLLTSLAAIFDNQPIIMENPCDTHFYDTLNTYKYKIISLPYNPDTFKIEDLYNSGGNILFIEPDSRFPRSVSMNTKTRKEILKWANEADNRYIIELGYDSELQWETQESIYSMDDNNKVIYLNTFSRSIGPGIKTAYMLLPPELLELWKKKHIYYYSLVSKTDQYILAEFINKGHFTKHYKAMRKIYKEKRTYLKDYMNEKLGSKFQIISENGSTYFTFNIAGKSALEIKQLARRCGVKLLSLNSYNIASKCVDEDAIIMGFGNLSKEKMKLGIHLIADHIL